MLFPGKNFLNNFLKQELWRWKEWQWKSQIYTNSSELRNKECPLICIKDLTMLISIFQQAGESSPKRCIYQLCLEWHQVDIGLGLSVFPCGWPGEPPISSMFPPHDSCVQPIKFKNCPPPPPIFVDHDKKCFKYFYNLCMTKG